MEMKEDIKEGDEEELMMDKNGLKKEGRGENNIIIKKNKNKKKRIEKWINGITRQSVIKIAQDFGYEVQEKDLTYDDLVNSDEAFFSGTAVEITPVSKIDSNIIGSGSRGEVTAKLQQTYSDIVSGKNDLYKDWLSLVS